MKVIAIDYFNEDYKSERLLTVSISEEEAKIIADTLNQVSSTSFYRIVEDTYTLDLQ